MTQVTRLTGGPCVAPIGGMSKSAGEEFYEGERVGKNRLKWEELSESRKRQCENMGMVITGEIPHDALTKEEKEIFLAFEIRTRESK